jgi:hypothetical protein
MEPDASSTEASTPFKLKKKLKKEPFYKSHL